MYNSSYVQAQTTVTGTGASAWQDTLSQPPQRGINCNILVNGVIGNPDVLFVIETTNDPTATTGLRNNQDPQGPVNVPCQRNVVVMPTLGQDFRYWRLRWLFNEQDPGEGSGNSSSLSSQTFNSSSSGGSAAISFFASIAPSVHG